MESKLCVKKFYQTLLNNEINFFTGVPDSLLKNVCAYITEKSNKSNHIIAANEGNAVGIAAGYNLSTQKIPLVYLQNSGFGNLINPLTSLIHENVYQIPILFMIGWRAEPGKKDEPQHLEMGNKMEQLFQVLNLEYCILSNQEQESEQQINKACSYMKKNKKPYVLLVSKDTFEKFELSEQKEGQYIYTRQQILEFILQHTNDNQILVSTTGMLSRELYEYRIKNNQIPKDIINPGAMGHCSSIGLGISLSKPKKDIIVLDGDGSVLMHMGSLAVNGCNSNKNFKHIMINNGSHDSVGGQPTEGFNINFSQIFSACNYKVLECEDYNNQDKINQVIKEFLQTEGPVFLELRCKKGFTKGLGRPDNIKEIKNNFQLNN
jgi:phosphonopyruvate decarboxylase